MTWSNTRPTGARVRLDDFCVRHLNDPAYLAWLRNYDVVRTLNLPAYWEPVAFSRVEDYVHRILVSKTERLFALVDIRDEAFIGTMKAGHVDWDAGTADVGIMIGERDRWGQGLARDGIRSLCEWLFNACGLRRLTAGYMAINPAMESPFLRNGFKREGVLRQHDRLREGGFSDHILLGCFADEFSTAIRGEGSNS